MKKMDWKKTLNKYKDSSANIQTKHKKEMIAAFKEMVRNVKSEKEFASYTYGLVFFPEMLYFALYQGRH